MPIFANQSVHHRICQASFARDGLRKWSNLTTSDSIHWLRCLTSLSCRTRNSIANPRSDQIFSATQNQCIELNIMTVSNCSLLRFLRNYWCFSRVLVEKEMYEIWSFCWHFKSSSPVSQDVLSFYFLSSSLLHSYHFGRDTYWSATPDFSK